MNLTNQSDVVETQEFKINGEWHMRGTKVEWDEVVLPQYPDIRYSKVSSDCKKEPSSVQLPCQLSLSYFVVYFCLLFTDNKQVCRFSLQSGRNVRCPRRMLLSGASR